jgi:hypothetical protein
MASRERRRAERSKRKARSVERRGQIAASYEERNRAAREALEPLPQDERPPVVTVGAVISGLIAASVVIAYLAGAEVNGERPPILQVIPSAVVMGVMSFGMWRARYWAVLGFQAILALLILAAALGLVSAGSAAQLVGNLTLIAIAGSLFYFMIKALARIQMPERAPRE